MMLENLVTFDVEFVVKRPSLIAEFSHPTFEELPDYIFKDAVEELLSRSSILTSRNWARESNSKIFRPPSPEDRRVLERSIAAARGVFLYDELPRLIPEGAEYLTISEHVAIVQFGCVSGRMKAIVSVGTFVAAVIAAASSATDTVHMTWLDRPNVSVSCTAQLSTASELKHHFRVQLRYQNPSLFNNSDAACVVLRQSLLRAEGYYNGAIDGIYGTRTAQAELEAAKKLLIPSDDLIRLYGELLKS